MGSDNSPKQTIGDEDHCSRCHIVINIIIKSDISYYIFLIKKKPQPRKRFNCPSFCSRFEFFFHWNPIPNYGIFFLYFFLVIFNGAHWHTRITSDSQFFFVWGDCNLLNTGYQSIWFPLTTACGDQISQDTRTTCTLYNLFESRH